MVSAALHGATLQTLVAKVVGRQLVRTGRREVGAHIQWLEHHGFARNWEDFARSAPPHLTDGSQPLALST